MGASGGGGTAPASRSPASASRRPAASVSVHGRPLAPLLPRSGSGQRGARAPRLAFIADLEGSAEMRVKEGWEGIVLGFVMLVAALVLILGIRYALG